MEVSLEELVKDRRIRHRVRNIRQRRSSVNILIAIMESTTIAPRYKTELFMASRLNNKHFEMYFSQLVARDYLREIPERNSSLYALTPQGLEALGSLRMTRDLFVGML